MKKILLILVLFICISSIYAVCSPFERMALFDRNNTYTLDGVDYAVSIKEISGQLNSFDVTINSISYPSVHYESSFETNTGETAYLGKPYAASSVMYTSIDFCMEKAAEKTISQNEFDKDSNYIYYIFAGAIIILLIIIFYLLFKKKK